MGMKFIETTKPDILNIPRPTITQKKYYSFNSKLIPEKKSSIVCHKNTPNSTTVVFI